MAEGYIKGEPEGFTEKDKFKTPPRGWWDGDWDTLEDSVRKLARDEITKVADSTVFDDAFEDAKFDVLCRWLSKEALMLRKRAENFPQEADAYLFCAERIEEKVRDLIHD